MIKARVVMILYIVGVIYCVAFLNDNVIVKQTFNKLRREEGREAGKTRKPSLPLKVNATASVTASSLLVSSSFLMVRENSSHDFIISLGTYIQASFRWKTSPE